MLLALFPLAVLITEKVFGFLIAAIAVQLVLDGMVQIGVLTSVLH